VQSRDQRDQHNAGFCDLSQYLGSSKVVSGYNPATGNAAGTGRTAYANNQIRLPDLGPSAAILAMFPSPTNTTAIYNNYVSSGTGSYSQNSFDTRIDFAAAPTVRFSGGLAWTTSIWRCRFVWPLEGVGDGPGGLSGSSKVHNYSLASGVTKTSAPRCWRTSASVISNITPANKPDVGQHR